jgi:signal transduction histidine kinase
MSAALEAELARSRAAAARGSTAESAPLDIAEGLVAVVERTERGETIAFAVEIDADLRTPVDASDLAEMLGALIENAARHARRQVRIEGARKADRIVLRVEDDGPGMDAAMIERATQRGVRMDETGSGHGLGLAIVRDLAEATEGAFRLDRARLGGLAAELDWAAGEDHPPKVR